MGYRSFTDAGGVLWEVWDVRPHRRATATGERPLRVSAGLAEGWLCCETRHERRRVAPIPEGWETLSDAELEALCRRATTVTRSRRLIE